MTTLRPGLVPILAFLQDQGFDVQRKPMYHQSFYNLYLESDEGLPLRTAFPVPSRTQLLDSNDEAVRDAKAINTNRQRNEVAVPDGDRLKVYDLSTLYNKVRRYQHTAVPMKTFVDLARNIGQRPKGFEASNRASDAAAYLHWQKNIESHLTQLLEFIVNGVDRRQKVSRADMEAVNPSNMDAVQQIFDGLSAALPQGGKRQKTNVIADRSLCHLIREFVPKCTSKYQLMRIFEDEDALNYIRMLYLAYMLDVNLSESSSSTA